MKFTKETTKAIRNWLKEYDFEVGCRLGNEFLYEPNDNYISIGRIYDNEVDGDFMKCLRKLGLKSNYDCVTLSILHELGHYMTYEDFSEYDWENDTLLKEVISHEENEHKRNFAYWNTMTEKSANEWVVYFADNRTPMVDKLEEIISIAVIQ